MATFFPLIANSSASQIQELPLGDILAFDGSTLDYSNTTVSNITVTVNNLHITGGTAGQALTTDGAGTLTWANAVAGTSAMQPAIEFSPTVTAAGQTFTDANIATFLNNTYATVYLNGTLLTTSEYTITGSTMTVLPTVTSGDTLSIGPVGPGGGTVTSVGTNTVDPSSLGFTLSGGTITTAGTVTLNVPTVSSIKTSLNYGNISDVNLSGNVQQYLVGDGTWQPVTPSPKHYLMATSNTPQRTVKTNDTLQFSQLATSSVITYNNSTSVVSLLAGKTYRLTATSMRWSAWSATVDEYLEFSWVNATTNVPLTVGGIGTVGQDQHGGQIVSANEGSITADIIYTATVNTDVKLMVTYTSSDSYTMNNGTIIVTEI